MKVAITGATGFVGQALVRHLAENGSSVVVLTRNPQRARRLFPESAFPKLEVVAYNPCESGAWQASISGCTGVVNLAGAPIADHRWTADYKREIMESRTRTTEKLVEAIAAAPERPQVLLNASAVGYYGTSETETFDETSGSGEDYLAQVCQAWEAAAQAVTVTGTRLVIARFGIILGRDGGALAKMLTPFQLFAGGPIGSGKQWVSWVHREDVVRFIAQALSNPEFSGVYNATAPNPVRMQTLCQVLGEVMSRPSWLPVPEFALELLLGEGAMVVLDGQQVLPKQTLAAGFDYHFPTVKPALENVLAE
ncbi:thylakoid membrane protein ThyD [Sodalinema gerasimenkoae]|uniref:thylakoid membrane protein ThyD n=1 Tax=Sodalinema gerasimenkoae TaxID=2862348 RepID=UPI00135B0EC1|nr:TIGR01777 family oxidoreductase [Sodalinema gerasimenkoae]